MSLDDLISIVFVMYFSLDVFSASEMDCKLRLNGTPVPLLRNGYSIFNGTKYR